MGYFEDLARKRAAKNGVNLKSKAAQNAAGNELSKKINKGKGITANPGLQDKKKK